MLKVIYGLQQILCPLDFATLWLNLRSPTRPKFVLLRLFKLRLTDRKHKFSEECFFAQGGRNAPYKLFNMFLIPRASQPMVIISDNTPKPWNLTEEIQLLRKIGKTALYPLTKRSVPF